MPQGHGIVIGIIWGGQVVVSDKIVVQPLVHLPLDTPRIQCGSDIDRPGKGSHKAYGRYPFRIQGRYVKMITGNAGETRDR